MNEQQLAAVKQALEAIKTMVSVEWSPEFARKEYDSDEPEENERRERVLTTITALQSIISQNALDKKADNARELGLSYDDNFCDKNCVWTDHHPDCKAVQSAERGEPVAPKPWVGLTDEEREEIWKGCNPEHAGYVTALVEAKLKEKNT